MRTYMCILIALAAAAGASLAAPAKADSGKAVVKVTRQILLKNRLMKVSQGELTASISHNRKEWDSLTPDQRDQYRREALAFANKNPQDQEKLIRHYDELIKMSASTREQVAKRAAWLEVVANSLTQQQRDELLKLTPQERARELLALKAQLIKQGKLPPDAPTTRPTSQPAASRPAK